MSCHHNAIWWSSSVHSVTSCGFGYWSQPEFKSIKWKLLEVTMSKSQIACHSGWHDELLSHSGLSTQDVVHSFLQSIHCRASVSSLVHYLMHCCRIAMFEFKQPLCRIHTLCHKCLHQPPQFTSSGRYITHHQKYHKNNIFWERDPIHIHFII